MDSIKNKISQQLINAGFTDFEFVKIDKARIELDGNGKPFYEKTRLLTIFKNRLKGCLLYDPENQMLDFLKNSVETLEGISDDTEIYYWQIKENGTVRSGRSTENQVLHIFPIDQETSL